MNSVTSSAGTAQVAANAQKKGGRKRKRAREVEAYLRRELPSALARVGDLETVSEDYGVAKVEVLAEAVVYLLRARGPHPERGAVQLVRRMTA